MYTLNGEKLVNELKKVDLKSADIFQWTWEEFYAPHAWVEITQEEFKSQTDDPILWSKKGERIFNDRLYKWDDGRFYIRSYRSDHAPIKGWLRRVMKEVHKKARYSQKDIERIAKAIRLSVEKE